jgi:hypothetical protein
MAQPEDIDFIVNKWPFQPGVVSVRMVQVSPDRKVMQMRVELGVLQMEIEGRPDGLRPSGFETYLDFLNSQMVRDGEYFTLTDEHRAEVDREILQYYHRRICCIALREFNQAIADADHTLALMDFIAAWSNDGDWIVSHEQYRPYVLFHRAQSAALYKISQSDPPGAIEEIDSTLEQIRTVFQKNNAEERYDDDDLVSQLIQLKESLRKEYNIGRTLTEQLSDAIAEEKYEYAAKLRDEIAKRKISD